MHYNLGVKKRYFQSLIWVIKLQWRASRLAFGWSILSNFLKGLVPLASAYAVAQLIASASLIIQNQASVELAYAWLMISLIIALINELRRQIDRVVSNMSGLRVYIMANELLFNKVYELSQEQFDNQAFNTKLERSQHAITKIRGVIDVISQGLPSLIGFLGSIIAISIISPLVGAIIVLTLIPTLFFNIWQNNLHDAVHKKIEPEKRIAARSSLMLVHPSKMLEIRFMNAFKQIIAVWREHRQKADNAINVKNRRLARIGILSGMIQPFASFGASIYFLRLLISKAIGLDQFIFAFILLAETVESAAQAAEGIRLFHELSVDLQNFNEVYKALPTIANGRVKIKPPLTIEFQEVSFTYPNTEKSILNNISFKIASGSRWALVGENGAGKTTLIKLLLRQYLPTKGVININGVNIQDIEADNYYSSISNLSQEFFMIEHLSVKDNLLMGLNRQVSDREIYRITDLVDATKFLRELPHQLHTRLEPSFSDGTNLSVGQKQRLSIGRALLRHGDLMILDEPTSAIDAKAEHLIFNNIYKTHLSKTILIVSHRFSTVRKADQILVMDKGEIIERGSHRELLDHDGLYKEMFEIQSEGYK